VLKKVLQPLTDTVLDADVAYLDAKEYAVEKEGENSETEGINCEERTEEPERLLIVPIH
jgi:hypothetical protein